MVVNMGEEETEEYVRDAERQPLLSAGVDNGRYKLDDMVQVSFISAKLKGVLGVLGVLGVAGGLALLLSFRHILEYFVTKFLTLEPSSQLYPMWKEPPLPIYISVYLFNITNRNEFPWNRSKPSVQQVGPYVFREHWNRTDIKWYENGTLSYTKVRTYQFIESMTVGSLDDVITSINIPAIGVGQLGKESGPFVRVALSFALSTLHEKFFVEKKVRQVLFEGYDDPIITIAKQILGRFPFDKFGYFYGRNGSTTEEYNIYTGNGGNMHRFTIIEKYRNKTKLDTWDGEECNEVRGTDGSTHPPFLDQSRKLEIFTGDFCRVMEIGFKEVTNYHGLPAYTFELKRENFDNGTKIAKNKCYCLDGYCLKSGAINMSRCLMGGAPLALSMPHFYTADPEYLDSIQGLNPNPALHSSYFVLEPVSAFPLKTSAKFQLNVMIERIPNFSFFDKLPNMMFPLLWFEEKSEMTEELVHLYDNQLYQPLYYAHVSAYSLIGVGATFGVAAVLYFAIARKQKMDSHQLNNNINKR
ncbi:scavenger receptor class B, member [Chamberlinius hualienensis]